MIDATELREALQGARDDAVLARLGRFCSNQIMLVTSTTVLHLDIEAGKLVRIAEGPFQMRSWQFSLRAEDASWLEFWRPQPRPGYQDIFAMSRFGHLFIEGDIAPLLTHLRFFKRLLALPRGIINASSSGAGTSGTTGVFE